MSLYHVLKANGHQPFSTDCVREIGIQLFDALDHLHGIGIIHTDLKPENILLVSNNSDSKDMRIKLIDLGSAEYERDANRHSIVNTRQYRAPEILLRIGWSFPSDVWAAGCAIAELQLGSLLFPAKEDVEHLALIERIMGVFPRWMLLTASTVPDSIAANCFNPVSGNHRMEAVLNPDGVAYVNKKEPLADQLGTVADCISISDVLQEILCIDPMFRPTARLAKELCVDIGKIQESDSDGGDETD
jgi:serine/threonine protein kinase